jgi:hypothetical protein
MEMSINIEAVAQGWQVCMAVCLDRAETSELFLAGDALISWPTENMLSTTADGPFERSSMFLSEVVARPAGLALEYETRDSAERTAKILAYQVRAAVPAD